MDAELYSPKRDVNKLDEHSKELGYTKACSDIDILIMESTDRLGILLKNYVSVQ